MAPRRPMQANILVNIKNSLILEALGGCLGRILEGLRGVLEALGGVLGALEGVLKAFWRLLKSSWRPYCAKIALESENLEKHKEKHCFLASCRGCLGRLGGSWGRLGGS